MKRLIAVLFLSVLLAVPVNAEEISAPPTPESAQELLPLETQSFGKDLWYVVRSAFSKLQPKLTEAAGVCVSLVGIAMLVSIMRGFAGESEKLLDYVAALGIGGILLSRTGSMILLGSETVQTLSDYGKLLLPVMTTALAFQGASGTSAALYMGTMVFDAFLSAAISRLLIPLVYGFLALSVANAASGEELLGKLKDFFKWLMTWFLKIGIFVFTGFLGITGVVSGSVDAAAMKATKLTISGMVPVVGGMLSDATEAVLVGAGVMKNAVGVSGLLALLAIWISPFLEIGIQYLLLKLTAAVCAAFGVKRASTLMDDVSKAMGFLLAMTGTVCLLLLVSTVCFMKGVAT